MLKIMVVANLQAGREKRAAVFFGTVLCLLLAFFAIERRVAAYPAHNVAAVTIAATGVQKPDQVASIEPQSLQAPVIFLCMVLTFAALPAQRIVSAVESRVQATFCRWAPAPLAVRPPPAL
jgi:hypothetical protein